jgi:hypothetical protein
MKLAAGIALLAFALGAGVTPASAAITYDYAQAWMYDSATGLYWQVLQVPSSTFVPNTGTIATFDQLITMQGDVGLPEVQTQTAPYSQSIANVLSFFQSDAPAGTSPTSQHALSVGAAYLYPADTLPDGYEYWGFAYSAVSTGSWTWFYSSATTIGDYGPGNPCSSAVDGGPPCPATEPAFVVSTVQPVPLPPTLWLMLSALSFPLIHNILRRSTRYSESEG